VLAQEAPWEVTIIAVYMVVRDAAMLNTLVPLTLFAIVMSLPLPHQPRRGLVAAVPEAVVETAMGDGCTRAQAYRRIILPLLAPGRMATSLFGLITAWNEFALVLVLNRNPEAQTLPLWLSSFQSQFGNDWGATMAASSLFAIPILILFVYLQRKAVSGL